MKPRQAVVVGAGIAGLATATGLAQTGWTVTVLERRPDVSEVGAGIVLWPNAIRALEVLGLAYEVTAGSNVGQIGGFFRPDGRRLAHVDADTFMRRHGRVAATERGTLLTVLHNAARQRGVRIITNCPATAITNPPSGPAVVHTATDMYQADLVVGADGLRSTVRSQILPTCPGPRPTGLTAWRWVVNWDEAGQTCGPWASDTLGVGMEFGVVPLPGRRVYCFASSAARRGLTPGPEEYRNWHGPIRNLVDVGTRQGMLCNELWDLPPLPSFTQDQAVLVGDAAHAMTPHLGQGAAQGLEDAACLTLLARAQHSLPEVLVQYERLRLPRAHALQKASRQAMRPLATTGHLAAGARDLLMTVAPDPLVAAAMARWATPSFGEPATSR